MIGLLADDIFNDNFYNYYLVIDRLDEDWVDDNLRFKLLRSLIEAIRTFKRVHNVKIIVALRTDLLYRLVKESTEAGFQEEKYRSLYLNLRWSRQQLTGLLDSRVTYMFERQYTRNGVKLDDIMPTQQIQRKTATDYILERTFQRPREAIIFLNECISRSEGASRISMQMIQQSELSYSQQRLTSVADEWRREYPFLELYTNILRRQPIPFRLGDIPIEECEKFAYDMIMEGPRDTIVPACEEFYTGSEPDSRFVMLYVVFQALYHVGIIAVKLEPHLPRQWSTESIPLLSRGQLKPATQIDVHKTFHAALGVSPRARAVPAAPRREIG